MRLAHRFETEFVLYTHIGATKIERKKGGFNRNSPFLLRSDFLLVLSSFSYATLDFCLCLLSSFRIPSPSSLRFPLVHLVIGISRFFLHWNSPLACLVLRSFAPFFILGLLRYLFLCSFLFRVRSSWFVFQNYSFFSLSLSAVWKMGNFSVISFLMVSILRFFSFLPVDIYSFLELFR